VGHRVAVPLPERLHSRLHPVEQLLRDDRGHRDADPLGAVAVSKGSVFASLRRFRRTGHPVVVPDARIHLVLQQVSEALGVPQRLAALREHPSLFERPRDGLNARATRVRLEHPADDLGLLLVHDDGARRGRRLRHVVIPEGAVALAHDTARADAVPPATRRALDDFLTLELGEGAEHRERKRVLGIAHEILAADDDLLLGPQQFIDDDGLVRDLAGKPVGGVEIYRVVHIALRVTPQLFESGAVEHRAAVAVVNVFLHQDVAGTGDLLLELYDLALDGRLQ